MAATTEHVDGENAGQILLYALSTCVWCRKTKHLLDELGVAYDFIDMDTLDIPSLESTNQELKKWNPRCSYPTLVINNSSCIIGYDEQKIREALEK